MGEAPSVTEEEPAEAAGPEDPAADGEGAEATDPNEEEATGEEGPADGDEATGEADAPDKEDPAKEGPADKGEAAGKEKADGKEAPAMPAFKESAEVDGVRITVAAAEGTFPEGCTLQATAVTSGGESSPDGAASDGPASAEPAANENVALSYTFDIKVLDKDGEEIQPAEGKKVAVSFSAPQVADPNLGTRVYHESDELPVATVGDAATAVSEGFSLYTVEFTYGELTYEMDGDATVPLSDVLAHVGLVGEPTAVTTSDPELFSASNESGQWAVTAHKAFSSTEWMRVTIAGVEYEITVTDAAKIDDDSGLYWELSEDGELTISGSGPMPNYSYNVNKRPPWYVNRSSITKIVVESGVTSVGNYAFDGCPSGIEVSIPDSIRFIGDHNTVLINKARANDNTPGTGTVTIKRAKDDATEGVYSGQLLYATMDGDEGDVLYYWYNSDNDTDKAGGCTSTDTHAGSSISGFFCAATGYGYATAADTGKAMTVKCIAYRVTDDGRLHQVGEGSLTVQAANNSHQNDDTTTDPENPVYRSELSNTLSGLNVLLLEGEEDSGLTIRQLLGRAGVTHITCSSTYISNEVTSHNLAVATVEDEGKKAKIKPAGVGTADVSYGIYTSGCSTHGTQYSEASPYPGTIRVCVVGAQATPYTDAIVLSLKGLPTTGGASTFCAIDGANRTQVEPDASGNGTVTFKGLAPGTGYQILIEVNDPGSLTGTSKAQATYAATTSTIEGGGSPYYVALTEDSKPVVTKGGEPIGEAAPVVGDMLTAKTSANPVTYQWYVDGQPVSGETGATYTVQAGDYGKAITVQVKQVEKEDGTGYAAGEEPTQASEPTAAVTKKTPAAIDADTARGGVTISYPDEKATPAGGYEVSTDGTNAAASPASLAGVLNGNGTPTIYVRTAETDDTAAGEWVAVTLTARPGEPAGLGSTKATNGSSADGTITGASPAMEYSADGTNWTAVTGDAVTGLNPGTYFVRAKATEDAPHGAAAEVPVGSNFVELTDDNKPTISLPDSHETPVIGDMLTAKTSANPVTYQWYVDGQPVSGETGATYTVQAGDYGKAVYVVATQGTDSEGATLDTPITKESDATSAVAKRDGPAAPASAEAASFVPNYAEETFTVGDAYEVSTTQEDSGVIADGSLTGALDGSGKVYVRAKETADTKAGAWLEVALTPRPAAPEGLTTENASNGSTADGKIKGTTADMEYKPKGGTGGWTDASATETAAKPGIYLVRTKAAGGGPASVAAEVTVGSNYTALTDANKPTVTVSGDHNPPVVGDTLTATTTATDLVYQWYRDGDPISGADGGTYELTKDDVGKAITVQVKQVKKEDGTGYAAGEEPTQTSEPTSAVVKKTPDAIDQQAAKENVLVSYSDETVTPHSGYDVSTDGENAAETPASLTGVLDGEGTPTIYVRTSETADTAAGEWVAVPLTARPEAPTGLTTGNATDESTADGKIDGTTEGMEYSDDGGATWKAAANESTPVKPGTYLVRTKAAGNEPASKAAKVTVGSDLADAKEDAKAALKAKYDELKESGGYDEGGLEELKAAYDDAVDAIDKATAVDKKDVPLDNGAWKAEESGEDALGAVKTKAQKDQEAADAMSSLIKDLPDPEKVTLGDKEKVEAAKKAYDALTDDQKKLVPDAADEKLRDDADALKALVDEDEAAKVEAMIGKLPAAADVTADDKVAIEAARAAYDALTDDQKAKVSPEALKKLEAAEAALKDAKIVYTAVRGDGSSWAKGSAEGVTIAFKRNVNDDRTFGLFSGLKVDGSEVPKDGYTAVAGSVVVTLSPAYLETLSVGGHKLTAMFSDADDVDVDFEVLEAAGTKATTSNTTDAKATSAKTGDTMPIALLAVSAMLSLAVLLVSRTRTRKPVRTGKHGH